jgi:hypothetical protein
MTQAGEVSGEISDLEKCTKQFVLIVEKSAKFLSSQQKADLFTVKSVSAREGTSS